eukprot:2556317-Prymnesium_polylepis.2
MDQTHARAVVRAIRSREAPHTPRTSRGPSGGGFGGSGVAVMWKALSRPGKSGSWLGAVGSGRGRGWGAVGSGWERGWGLPPFSASAPNRSPPSFRAPRRGTRPSALSSRSMITAAPARCSPHPHPRAPRRAPPVAAVPHAPPCAGRG